MTDTTPLSWKPKASGKVYCAPACGRGCTRAEYNAATRRVHALCKRLGRGWKPHVWENLGWHYSAISPCGRWKVHASTFRGKIAGYTAFLGHPGPKWAETGKTPESRTRARGHGARPITSPTYSTWR